MPVLHMGWDDDDIPGVDNLDWTAVHLDASRTSGDDEDLTEWMGVPCASSSRSEGHDSGRDTRRCIRREQLFDLRCAGKELR